MIDALKTGLSFLPLKLTRNKLAHVIPAADPALTSRAGLKYYLRLNVPAFAGSTTLAPLLTSEGRESPPTTTGGATVYPGAEFRYNHGRNGKIDGLLTYAPPTPGLNGIGVVLSQTAAFSLTELVQGGTPTVDTEIERPRQYAIKAGLSNEDFYGYGDNFFTTYQSAARRFLTWQPDFKRIRRDAAEYLYFLLNFTPKPSTVKVRIQYTTGAGSTVVSTVWSLSNPPLYGLVYFPITPSALGIPADVTFFEVWLSDEADARLSEVRAYYVEDRFEAHYKEILFVNGLGGWDTLRLTGESQRVLSVSQTTADVERPADAGVDFSELRIISIEGEHTITTSTGYFRRDATAWLRYLDELLLSDQIFLITDKGRRPLQLLTNSLIDDADNTDLIARAVSFRILDTVENYSDLPAAEPEAARPMAWRGLSQKYVLDGYGKRTGYIAFERLEKYYTDDNTAVIPATLKPNAAGDVDFIAPVDASATIPPGSTPYPSALISRAGSFKRSNCGASYLGGFATITIAAGRYGGEHTGDADALAEAEYTSLNTQAYADTNGTCTLNNTPIHLAIFHKIPMNESLQVAANTSYYGPVASLWINGSEIIPNSTGLNPAENRLSTGTTAPGLYNILIKIFYANQPLKHCKIKLATKGREVITTGPGSYLFENIQINSSDEPLTFEILNV